jgi:hypothetical protein
MRYLTVDTKSCIRDQWSERTACQPRLASHDVMAGNPTERFAFIYLQDDDAVGWLVALCFVAAFTFLPSA